MSILSPPQAENSLLVAARKCLLSFELENPAISVFHLPERKDPVEGDDETDTKTKPHAEINRDIQNCAVSEKNLLAVTTNNKVLFLFTVSRWNPLEANLIGERKIPRVSSAIRFSPNGESLLVADKSGDCTLYDCTKENLPETHLGGHLSIVTDILFSPDQRFFITCDRDEKIRVTKFPEIHEIESYCLGHREFVSNIDFLPHNPSILMSLSGDSTLRLWNYLKGKELYKITLPGAGIRMISTAENPSSSLFAAYVHETDSIIIGRISGSNEFKHEILKTISTEDFFLESLTFSRDRHHLMAFGVSQKEDKNPEILAYNLTDNSKEDLSEINEKLKDRLGNFKLDNPAELLSGLFKKKYSNVEEYHERKRKRLEEKSSKKIN
ncbi:tRNA (guanine-N(7)-)-methyltransferase non-catalytic subunit wuho [Sergentomyia squamirostris]